MLYSESSTVLTIMIYECSVTKVISYTFCSTRCKCFTLLTSARKPSATNPWCEFIDLMMKRSNVTQDPTRVVHVAALHAKN